MSNSRFGLGNPGSTSLTGLELHNFKSIKSARVRIRLLTIVAGANSAGKSSLLQSILALTQVSRRRIDGNQFPLNDELTKLGTFPALKHQKAEPYEPLRISFRFESQMRDMLRYGRLGSPALRDSSRHLDQIMDDPVVVNWAIELDSQADIQIGSAQISTIEVKVDNPDLFCSVNRMDDFGAQDDSFQLAEKDEAKYSGFYSKHTDRYSGSYIGTPETTIEDARIVSGHLTALFGARVDLKQQASDWFAEADLEGFNPDDQPEARIEQEELVSKIVQAIEDTITAEQQTELIRQYSCHNSQERQAIRDRVFQNIDEAQAALPMPRLDRDNNGPAHLIAAQRMCSRYLANNVRYIGPLRHAPHLPFGSAPDPDSGSVGTSGEHVAAILQAKRNIERPYPLPNEAGKTVSLEEAVGKWLSFFELADSLSVHEGTPLVYSINLQPPGLEDPVPLSSVGVGVSQVLPIIVQCLVAGPGTLILLEQPELHLHPAAQQRLADFLIACTNWGQFILVESHSEYLVLRLRRRIAQDRSDLLRDKIAIYFAERDQDGDTTFQMVNLTETGGVVEWPDGFFDQGQSEAHQLLVAAAARGSSEAQVETEVEISETEQQEFRERYKTRKRDKGRPRTRGSYPPLQDPKDEEELDEAERERRETTMQRVLQAQRQEQQGLLKVPRQSDLNTFDSPIRIYGITLTNLIDLEDLTDCASSNRTARQIIRQAMQELQPASSAQSIRLRLQNLLEWYS